ncbi:MAG: helix-turn-helix transcriptional regulator [Traorella sp.]
MEQEKQLTNFTKSIAILIIIYQYGNVEKPISTTQIKEIFETKYNTSIDSRTIEKVVESFNSFQDEYEIEFIRSKPHKYYFSSVPGLGFGEAKAIIDLIYSSHFFTVQTKKNFIEQMKSWFNISDANKLNKALPIHISRNEDSKSFFESFDRITTAISNSEVIFFDYIKPTYLTHSSTSTKRKVYPIETVCDNNNFYLYCYKVDDESIRNYRIDYIHNVSLTGMTFEPKIEILEKIMNDIIDSTAAYGPQRYATITLKFKKELYSNMIDKFGNHIKRNIHTFDNDYYSVTIDNCPLSSTFYGWLIGFEGNIQLIAPIDEVEKFKEFLLNEFINR